MDCYQCVLAIEKWQSWKPKVLSKQSNQLAHTPESYSIPPTSEVLSKCTLNYVRCGKSWHKATKCKRFTNQKKKTLLIKKDINNDAKVLSDSVYDENDVNEVLYKDGHKTLIVRKSFFTLKNKVKDDWLKMNIFHTICTITDKVYMMIIDSDSC